MTSKELKNHVIDNPNSSEWLQWAIQSADDIMVNKKGIKQMKSDVISLHEFIMMKFDEEIGEKKK